MKSAKIASILVLLGVLTVASAAVAQGGDCSCPCQDTGDNNGDPGQASDAYFHQQLSPYGDWVAQPGYGEVWVPRVAASWRPYTTGHWIYTDQGWAWVADESWGWAPFHYGRWYYTGGVGWGWVPGYTWAPAWVAWRNGGGYVGWAPLPPTVGFTAGVGINWGRVNIEAAIAPSYYSFVSASLILSPRLNTVIAPVGRNVTFIRNTNNITNISVVNNRVVNNGVPVQQIQQATGQAVPVQHVAGQAGFTQPAVMARAARVTSTETFTNRPAPSNLAARTTGLTTGRTTTGRNASTMTTGTTGKLATGRRIGPSGTMTTGATTGTTGNRRHQITDETLARSRTGATTGSGSSSSNATVHTSGATTGKRQHQAATTGGRSGSTPSTHNPPPSHTPPPTNNPKTGSTGQTHSTGQSHTTGSSHPQEKPPVHTDSNHKPPV